MSKSNCRPQVTARLVRAHGKRVAATPKEGLSAEAAAAAVADLQAAGQGTVREVQHGKESREAVKPYITSSLQQDAAKLLGMSVKATMSTAQELFESARPLNATVSCPNLI